MKDFFVHEASAAEAEMFRRMLPKDWQKVLPKDLEKCAPAIFYVGTSKGQISVGAILFLETAPVGELSPLLQKQLFHDGFKYIGYLFVPENKRGRGFGSRFLDEMTRLYPKLWLTCDKVLDPYYIRNGCRFVTEYIEDGIPGSVFTLERSEAKEYAESFLSESGKKPCRSR